MHLVGAVARSRVSPAVRAVGNRMCAHELRCVSLFVFLLEANEVEYRFKTCGTSAWFKHCLLCVSAFDNWTWMSTAKRFSTLAWRPLIWRSGPIVSPSSDGTHSGCLTTKFDKAITKKIIQDKDGEDEPTRTSALRRLSFEAQVMTVGDLLRLSCRTEDDAPRSISLRL